MKVADVLDTAKDAITVRRVYSEPVERDGLTIIPAATVGGAGGGGTGHDEKGQEGEGGGFAMRGRPAGAYVVRNGAVTWSPALDVNRVVAAVAAVLVAYLLTRPRMARLHMKRARVAAHARPRGARQVRSR